MLAKCAIVGRATEVRGPDRASHPFGSGDAGVRTIEVPPRHDRARGSAETRWRDRTGRVFVLEITGLMHRDLESITPTNAVRVPCRVDPIRVQIGSLSDLGRCCMHEGTTSTSVGTDSCMSVTVLVCKRDPTSRPVGSRSISCVLRYLGTWDRPIAVHGLDLLESPTRSAHPCDLRHARVGSTFVAGAARPVGRVIAPVQMHGRRSAAR
jgi:hypothetical protein